ncbi:MAG: sensor domain-containing diguanylate cyclase [Elusimicrobiota bacterium]
MWYEIISGVIWLLPVLFITLKQLKGSQIFGLCSIGIFIFIFCFVKSIYFYHISGMLFLIVAGIVRYNSDKKFGLLYSEHLGIKEKMNTDIVKTENEIIGLTKNTAEAEKNIATYEMFYSISKILVKQIDLNEIVKNIKSVVFFLRPFIKTFEIYTGENLPKKWSGFEVPVLIGEERLGVIQLAVDKEIAAAFSYNFLEECEVISHQVALGLKRARLYQLVLERSRIDGLTGLYLRRYFIERLKQEFVYSRRYGTFFSFLIIDIDHFKKINDTYGHLTGDKILSELATIFKSVFHPGIIVSRYGGEEFAVVVGLTPKEEVKQLAEKLRKTVEEHLFAEDIQTTISIGIAYRHQAESEDEIIRKADEALYRAKNKGRNKVVEY